jgi:hypothetical protein
MINTSFWRRGRERNDITAAVFRIESIALRGDGIN